jgi:hypothetical protein
VVPKTFLFLTRSKHHHADVLIFLHFSTKSLSHKGEGKSRLAYPAVRKDILQRFMPPPIAAQRPIPKYQMASSDGRPFELNHSA